MNSERDETEHIGKSKLKLFCKTRWIYKITTSQVFDEMYEPLLACFEGTSSRECGCDGKAVAEASALMKHIADSRFNISFQIVVHFFLGGDKQYDWIE